MVHLDVPFRTASATSINIVNTDTANPTTAEMQNMATPFARAVHAEETWWGLANPRTTAVMSVKYAQLTGAIERSAQVACVGCITSESRRAQRLISIAKRAAKSLSSTAGRLSTAGLTVDHDAK